MLGASRCSRFQNWAQMGKRIVPNYQSHFLKDFTNNFFCKGGKLNEKHKVKISQRVDQVILLIYLIRYSCMQWSCPILATCTCTCTHTCTYMYSRQPNPTTCRQNTPWTRPNHYLTHAHSIPATRLNYGMEEVGVNNNEGKTLGNSILIACDQIDQ